ncbi:hypothetical protein Bca101_064800 [Brassica carinata]
MCYKSTYKQAYWISQIVEVLPNSRLLENMDFVNKIYQLGFDRVLMIFVMKRAMLEIPPPMMARKDELGSALTVLSSSISASTFMASIALTLSSLIGAWIGSSPVNMTVFTGHFVYGDTSSITMVIKYTSLLVCFLVAFCCFVQSTRCFLHANYLITTPGEDIPPEMVKRAVLRGGNFWSLGLRCIYLALNLLLWLFGPIPMFINSVLMVICLYYLDANSVVQPLYHRTFEAEQIVKSMRGVLAEPLTYKCN